MNKRLRPWLLSLVAFAVVTFAATPSHALLGGLLQLVGSLVSLLLSPVVALVDGVEQVVVPQQVIVRFTAGASSWSISSLLNSVGGKVLSTDSAGYK